MGNLLGSPITDKETHTGMSRDGSLQFGLSSMQGWRVHMEDAHICQLDVYAQEPLISPDKLGSGADSSNIPPTRARRSKYMKSSLVSSDLETYVPKPSSMYKRLPLPDHSLFAVFDGHGGSFAAEYAGAHFFRILSRQSAFVQYAHYVTCTTEPKETVVLTLLQSALRDAFVDLDREILLVERGDLEIEYDTTGPVVNDADTIEESKNESDAEVPPHPNKRKALLHSSDRLVVKPDEDPGCTALVVIVTPQFFVCANAGDSRAVYSRSGHRAIALSYDHKPDDEAEKRRIYRAGGSVHAGRVEGDLAVSRGLGDYRFKDTDIVEAGSDCFYSSDDLDSSSGSSASSSGLSSQRKHEAFHTPEKTKNKTPDDHMVSPIPDLIVYTRDEQQDEFIVLACDGIWDVQTNQECVSTVAKIFQEGEADMGILCEEVLDTCLTKGSKDNMTVIVIRFKAQRIGEGGGVKARRRQRLAATDPNNPNHHTVDY